MPNPWDNDRIAVPANSAPAPSPAAAPTAGPWDRDPVVVPARGAPAAAAAAWERDAIVVPATSAAPAPAADPWAGDAIVQPAPARPTQPAPSAAADPFAGVGAFAPGAVDAYANTLNPAPPATPPPATPALETLAETTGAAPFVRTIGNSAVATAKGVAALVGPQQTVEDSGASPVYTPEQRAGMSHQLAGESRDAQAAADAEAAKIPVPGLGYVAKEVVPIGALAVNPLLGGIATAGQVYGQTESMPRALAGGAITTAAGMVPIGELGNAAAPAVSRAVGTAAGPVVARAGVAAGVGGAASLADQVSERIATDKPIDWGQVLAGAGTMAAFDVGVQALHSAFKDKPIPQDRIDELRKQTAGGGGEVAPPSSADNAPKTQTTPAGEVKNDGEGASPSTPPSTPPAARTAAPDADQKAFEQYLGRERTLAEGPGEVPQAVRTMDELRRMSGARLQEEAGRWGVSYDSPSMTLPRILDAQERWRVEQMSDKQVWDEVRARGLHAGSRDANVRTLIDVTRHVEQQPSPPSESPNGVVRAAAETGGLGRAADEQGSRPPVGGAVEEVVAGPGVPDHAPGNVGRAAAPEARRAGGDTGGGVSTPPSSAFNPRDAVRYTDARGQEVVGKVWEDRGGNSPVTVAGPGGRLQTVPRDRLAPHTVESLGIKPGDVLDMPGYAGEGDMVVRSVDPDTGRLEVLASNTARLMMVSDLSQVKGVKRPTEGGAGGVGEGAVLQDLKNKGVPLVTVAKPAVRPPDGGAPGEPSPGLFATEGTPSPDNIGRGAGTSRRTYTRDEFAKILTDVAGVSPERAAEIAAAAEARGGRRPGDRRSGHVAIPDAEKVAGALWGEGSFLHEDVKPAARQSVAITRQAWDQVRQVLAPASRGADAATTALGLREMHAKVAQRYDHAHEVLREASAVLERRTDKENLDFIDAIEHGRPIGDTTLAPIAKAVRQMLDQRRRQVQALGAGKLERFVENYFPHIWENNEQAEKVLATEMAAARRTLEGSKAFLKQRIIPTTRDGVAKGLRPVSYNPVDLTLIKVKEMDRYIAAHEFFDKELKPAGLLKFVPTGEATEPGYLDIDDKIARVYGPPTEARPVPAAMFAYGDAAPKEFPMVGRWTAPESVARVINNDLSANLRDRSGAFKALLGAGNVLNQAQLGLGAFHLGFTSMDTMVSKAALGVRELSQGRLAEGAKHVAQVPIAPVENYLRGDRLFKEWMKPGSSGDPDLAQLADLMRSAGARAQMDPTYQTQVTRSMLRALRTGNYTGALLRAPFAAVEQISRPILEHVVPRQKLGVFMDMARSELAGLPAGADRVQVRAAMAKAWDSVDNRMGQMVYDNLFWDRTAKDLSMATTRSVGWNLGSFREILGGLSDAAQQGGRLARGQKPELTHRMAYSMIGLPVVTGAAGAMIQYLYTGEGPKELKDYFFPRTGGTDDEGNPIRLSLPTYMKDVYHFWKEPGRTLSNKLHPLIGTVADMLQNRDYYGTEIRNADDPLMKQVMDEAGFAGKQFVPFTVRSIQNQRRSGEPFSTQAASMIGLTKAPAGVTRTPAERLASEITAANRPVGGRTQEEAEKSHLKGEVARTYRRDPEAGGKLAGEAVAQGRLTPEQAKRAEADASLTALQRQFKGMSVEDAVRVFDAADDHEKSSLLSDEFRDKVLHSSLPAARQDAILAKAGIDAPVDLPVTRERHALDARATAAAKAKRGYAATLRRAGATDAERSAAREAYVAARLTPAEAARQRRLDTIAKGIKRIRDREADGVLDKTTADELVGRYVGVATN